jgi:hypothetical protein
MQRDYSANTWEELLDVKAWIEADKYPDRYRAVCDEIARRRAGGTVVLSKAVPANAVAPDDDRAQVSLDSATRDEAKHYWAVFVCIGVVCLVIYYGLLTPSDNLQDYHRSQVDGWRAELEVFESGGHSIRRHRRSKRYELAIYGKDNTRYFFDADHYQLKQIYYRLTSSAPLTIYHSPVNVNSSTIRMVHIRQGDKDLMHIKVIQAFNRAERRLALMVGIIMVVLGLLLFYYTRVVLPRRVVGATSSIAS